MSNSDSLHSWKTIQIPELGSLLYCSVCRKTELQVDRDKAELEVERLRTELDKIRCEKWPQRKSDTDRALELTAEAQEKYDACFCPDKACVWFQHNVNEATRLLQQRIIELEQEIERLKKIISDAVKEYDINITKASQRIVELENRERSYKGDIL